MMRALLLAFVLTLLGSAAYAQNVPCLYNTVGMSPSAAATSAPSVQCDQSGELRVNHEGMKLTWSAAVSNTAPVATPTDWVCAFGAAGKVEKIVYVGLTGQSTTAGNMDVALVFRSTADQTGTTIANAFGMGKAGFYDGNATLTPSVGISRYSANPGTLGTTQAYVGIKDVQLNLKGLAGMSVNWDFGTHNDEEPTLRSATDALCVNFNGEAIPAGGVFDLEIRGTEEAP